MSIKISPKNPRFFEKDNRIIQLISSGRNGMPQDIGAMKRAGVNTVRLIIPFVKGKPLCPYKMTADYTDNYGDWNEKAFAIIEQFLDQSKNLDLITEIVIDSLPNLRDWNDHVLNAVNGGPVPENIKGAANRLTYDYNWKKEDSAAFNIYKGFLFEFIDRFPLDKYPNVIFTLFWEAFTGWRTSRYFIANLVREIHYRENERVVGVGNWNTRHLEWIRNEVGFPVHGQSEAWSGMTLTEKLKLLLVGKNRNQVLLRVGFWPSSDLYYEQKNTKLKCLWFSPGNERHNAIETILQIAIDIKKGRNPGLPFVDLFRPTTYTKRWGCDFYRYDYELYKNIVYYYLASIVEQYDETDLLSVTNRRFNKKIDRKTKRYIGGLNV